MSTSRTDADDAASMEALRRPLAGRNAGSLLNR